MYGDAIIWGVNQCEKNIILTCKFDKVFPKALRCLRYALVSSNCHSVFAHDITPISNLSWDRKNIYNSIDIGIDNINLHRISNLIKTGY